MNLLKLLKYNKYKEPEDGAGGLSIFLLFTCGHVTVNVPLIYHVNAKPGSSNSIQKSLHLQQGTTLCRTRKERNCQSGVQF